MTGMRGLAGLAAACLAATAAFAAESDFPAAMTREAVTAWVPAHTTLDPKSVVAVGGGRVFSVLGARAEPGSALVRVSVRTEIITAEAAAQAKALSEAQDLLVDCQGRRARLQPIRLYARRNLQGATRTAPAEEDWIDGAAGTVIGRIIAMGCEVRAPRAAASAPSVASAPARSPSAPPDQPGAPVVPRGLPEWGPAPRPALTLAPVPVLGAPVVTAPPRAQAAPATPVPTRAAAPAPAPAPRRLQPGLSVQIAALKTRAAAEAALAELRAQLPDRGGGRTHSVQVAQIGGQTYYRALVGGFAGLAEAKGLCSALKARGRDCLLRTS